MMSFDTSVIAEMVLWLALTDMGLKEQSDIKSLLS